jgi:hypothetical protein
MRKSIVACALLAGALAVLAQSPSTRVSAQEKTTAPKPKPRPGAATTPEASHAVDPGKEADIRRLMEMTGSKSLGEQLMKSGMEQFRASVMDSQPDNPRAKQFVDAFVARFQKHFDPDSLTDKVLPIYDKYLSSEDLKALIEYYSSPLGQRMLQVLPQVARESQEAGFALGQKAARETLEDLKADYPEFVPDSKDDTKHPGDEK